MTVALSADGTKATLKSLHRADTRLRETLASRIETAPGTCSIWPAHSSGDTTTAITPSCDGPLDEVVRRTAVPLITAFRALLERGYLWPSDWAFEVTTTTNAPTGRIVLTGSDNVGTAPRPTGYPQPIATVAQSARVVHQAITQIRKQLARHHAPGDVEVAINAALTDGLRFLSPEVAELLGGVHPLTPWVHYVPASQDRALREVLKAVKDRTVLRRHDPGKERPVVLVSDEHCLLPGARELIAAIEHNGGQVVCSTEYDHEHRDAIHGQFDLDGLGHLPILTVPHHRWDGDRSARAVTASRLIALAGYLSVNGGTVVAAFGGPRLACAAIEAVYPHALTVTVDGSGQTAEQTLRSGHLRVATFERTPELRAGTGRPPHVASLSALPLAHLRPQTHREAITLSEKDSTTLVQSLLASALARAERIAARAIKGCGADDAQATTLRAIHSVLSHRQFRRCARNTLSLQELSVEIGMQVAVGKPLHLVLPGFAVKQFQSRLKAFGHLPDLAEVTALAVLAALQRAISKVYRPGLEITIPTDGRHFRDRPAELTTAYATKLDDYLTILGRPNLRLIDIDQLAAEELDVTPSHRAVVRDEHRRTYECALSGLDIADNPLETLRRVDLRDPTPAGLPRFAELFRSIVHSVDVDPAPSGDQLVWARDIYAHLYAIRDRHVPQEVRDARVQVLRRAWAGTIEYLANRWADETLQYSSMYGPHIRGSFNTAGPRDRRWPFAGLQGACPLPWQVSGAIDPQGRAVGSPVIALSHQGYRPVMSPLLGDHQPLFLVAAHHVIPPSQPGRPPELSPALLSGVRIRSS